MLVELKRTAIAEYEDLIWRLAEGTADCGNATDYSHILYAAEKSLEDFADDVEAIKRRIALQGEIAEYRTATEEKAKLITDKQRLEDELAKIMSDYEAKLTLLATEIDGLTHRQKNTSVARRHYFGSAPAWLRERLDEVSKQIVATHRDSVNLREPARPRDLTDQLVMDHDDRNRLHSKAMARYQDQLEEYNVRKAILPEQEAELKRERDDIHRAILLLRPTPEDL